MLVGSPVSSHRFVSAARSYYDHLVVLYCCDHLSSSREMDAHHSADMYKHLEKQRELLMEAYRSLSHELHMLQVEEEMLMRKCYQVTSAEGLTRKDKSAKDNKTQEH